MPQPCLEVDSLYFGYHGSVIFDGLSFSSNHRRTIFKGPSGCGKTTLLKILSGNLTSAKAKHLPPADSTCLLIQEDGLFPWLTGIDNVLRVTKLSLKKVTEHPMYPLVESFIKKKTYEMSFGQRRLVEVFRAIVYAPKYLYIDEPFNFLDVNRIDALVPFLREDFLKDTILTISSHHKEEDLALDAAIFRFEGDLPVTKLTREK